uniref:Collagen alpha-1(I) chain-like n=1 Tax=Heterorhabditis bacteriophora TaxID=37862 RepID=A0A1I7WH43_HETBA
MVAAWKNQEYFQEEPVAKVTNHSRTPLIGGEVHSSVAGSSGDLASGASGGALRNEGIPIQKLPANGGATIGRPFGPKGGGPFNIPGGGNGGIPGGKGPGLINET